MFLLPHRNRWPLHGSAGSSCAAIAGSAHRIDAVMGSWAPASVFPQEPSLVALSLSAGRECSMSGGVLLGRFVSCSASMPPRAVGSVCCGSGAALA